MDMQAVAEGLAAAAATVASDPKLITYAFAPDAVETPCCFVAEFDIDFDKTMGRGTDYADFTMRVLVGRADDVSAGRRLNALLSGSGGGALKQAIESNRGPIGAPALGGACDDYHVQRVQGMRWYLHEGTTYLGAEFRVHVIGSGSST